MEITATMVKELRAQTGAGIMDCKAALRETSGDPEKALEWLRKKGLKTAESKVGRAAKEGVILSYIHPGSRIGVLLELNCETDFVARTGEFQALAKDLTLQVTASRPRYVSREQIDPAVVDKEREIYRAQLLEGGKPAHIVDKIVEGRLEKFFEEVCILDQVFVKDTSLKVKDLLTAHIAKLGENIAIRRFARFEMGEATSTVAG